MIYNEFQGLKLSALGMGNMRLPVIDGDDNQIDVKAAEECLHTAWNPALTIMIPHTVITVENPSL